MAEGKVPFRYEMTRKGDMVVCTTAGCMDAPSAAALFDAVRREVTPLPARVILIYDATALDSLESGVIPHAQRSVRELDRSVLGFGVVSRKAFVRFAVSMVKLATPHMIVAFEELPEALAWGERTLRGR